MKKFCLFLLSLLLIYNSASPQVLVDGLAVKWRPNPEANVTGYKIYYGANSQEYIATVDVGNTTNVYFHLQGAIVTNPPPGFIYAGDFIWGKTNWPNNVYFAAKAYNNVDLESVFSEEIVFNFQTNVIIPSKPNNFILTIWIPSPTTNPPAPPQIFNIIAGDSFINLIWSNSTNTIFYNVKRSLFSGGPYNTIAATSNSSFTDITVVNDLTYYYVVSGQNVGGESDNSTEVNATPLGVPSTGRPVVISANGFARPNWGNNTNISLSLNSFGENRLVLAMVNWNDDESQTVTGVVFNNQPLTKLYTTNFYYSDTYAELYYLKNPPVGNNLVISTVTDGNVREISMVSCVLTNVNQIDTFGDIVANTWGIVNGGTSSPVVVVPSGENSLVLDYLSNAPYELTPITTPNQGQTLIHTGVYERWFSSYASFRFGVDGIINMGWNMPNSRVTLIGFTVKGF